MEKYTTWDNFSNVIYKRFTHPIYNVLPQKDLTKIIPITKEYCQILWNRWLGQNYGGWHTITKDSIIGDRDAERGIPYKNFGFSKEREFFLIKTYFKESMKMPLKTTIYFFWSKSTSVKTQWGVFLKYWDDFVYSSDNEDIIIFPRSNLTLTYNEGGFVIADRFKEFGVSKV